MNKNQGIRPSDISLIAFDFDGVLTDNRVFVFQDGREAVVCSRADGMGFEFLEKIGFPTVIVSRETNPVVAARARKTNTPVLSATTDKDAALNEYCRREAIDRSRVMFVGNDVNDLNLLRSVLHPVAVADAHPLVIETAKYTLETNGGDGVVREIIENLISFPPIDQVLS